MKALWHMNVQKQKNIYHIKHKTHKVVRDVGTGEGIAGDAASPPAGGGETRTNRADLEEVMPPNIAAGTRYSEASMQRLNL